MPELSSNIIFLQILTRLPAKSIRRFLCVSKQWLSFLSSPQFALHHATTNHDDQSHHKLLVFTSERPYNFRIIDCNPKENYLTSSRRRLPFEVRFLRYRTIAASFHGLLCVGILKSYPSGGTTFSDLMLWNPVTGDYKTLSKPPDSFNQECYDTYGGTLTGLYYSASDNDYKLLRVTRDSNVYIYSLKSDSWRKIIQSIIETFLPIYSSHDPKSGLFLNEKLYFLKQINRRNYLVIRFDTKTEKFTQIATPFSGNTRTDGLSFMLLRGCIHLVATISPWRNKPSYHELWRMDEDDQHGDYWTKVETISEFSLGEKPFHLMRHGNWLVRSDGRNGGNVYQYEVINKKKPYTYKRWLCSLGRSDILVEQRYMETLVSPNQYIIQQHSPLNS